MATETLFATSHITGTCSTPNNAVGDTETPTPLWTTNTGNTSWTSRWAIGDPANPLTANTQTITIPARRSGTGNGTPSWVMNLYENGTLVQQIGSGTVSTTGTVNLTGTFAGTAIANRANVEIELQVTGNGGGPNANTLQIEKIVWTADTAVVIPSGDGSASWGYSSATTENKEAETDVTISNGFSETETYNKGSVSEISIAFGFSESATGEVVSSEVNADISFSFGFSETADSGTERESDVAYSFSFAESATSEKTVEAEPILSFGHTETTTFNKSGEADLTQSWGHSETIEGTVTGTPAAVTDLAGVAGGSGEVVLTWSAPV